MTTHDFDRMLASWFEGQADTSGAATVLEATLERTARRHPRPAWIVAARDSGLGHRLSVDDRTRRRLGYALVLAAAIAALVIGVLLAAGQRPPRPSLTLACFGEPETLCEHTAGVWFSQSFLPGLTLTLPADGWYVRDLPDHMQLETAPMTSQVVIQLDPVPRAASWQPSPDLSGTVASLVESARRAPNVQLGTVVERHTSGGLTVTSFDVGTIEMRPCVKLFVTRGDREGPIVGDVCNRDVQRLHLVDLGGSHVLSVLVLANDHTRDTMERQDRALAPILDSIRPPGAIAP